MKKMVQVEKEQWSCDGCQYLMNKDDPRIEVRVPFDWPIPKMRDGNEEIFHFHALGHRHDCFRYWAHNPGIMTQSLKERGWNNQQIDDFLALMLYRENSFEPGIERPKEKVKI